MSSVSKQFLRLLALAASVVATTQTHAQTVSLSTIQQYAPTIYLNAYDNNHPTSVENFFSQSNLVDSNGNVITTAVTPASLAANTTSTNYLVPSNGVYPTPSNDFESGDAAVASSTANMGQVNSPVYVKVLDFGTYIDIKYFLFYPWNGFQPFQVGVITNFKTEPYNLDWAGFALHYGDWEHVTVRISEDQSSLIGVFYSQHSGNQWVTNPPLDGTHPIVYSGWDSHANYPTAGIQVNDIILNSPGLPPVSWVKVVDNTANTGTFTVYHKPTNFYSNGVIWTPWQNTSQLVLLDNNATVAQWLSFNGHWGPALTSTIYDPPSLPSGATTELDILAKGANFIGALSSYTNENGPLGPETQDWYISTEPQE
jgi:hypothetical protein